MNTEMVALTEFAFEENPIRVVGTQLDPWFVGVDVASALGYKNPQEAVRKHVPEGDKGVSELLTPGGVQKLVVIDEAGLYYLIFKSKLQAAQKFTWWVTHEVLPSIRKYGYYKVPKPVLEKKPVGRPPLALAGYVERQQKYIFANGEKCDITDLRWICRELGMPLEEVCDKRTSRMVDFVNEQMTARRIVSVTDIPKRGRDAEYEPDETYTVIADGEVIELVR